MMRCTRILDTSEHIVARDLYWEANCSDGKMKLEKVEELLLGCVEKNPFVGEAHIVLGQVYLGMKRFEAAEAAIERGLRLIVEWGSPWDKSISWQGWIAWGRVLLMKAKDKAWPDNPWAISTWDLSIEIFPSIEISKPTNLVICFYGPIIRSCEKSYYPKVVSKCRFSRELNCWEWKRIQSARREENSDEGKKLDCIFLRLE